jgi:hypothetical protein
VFGSEPDLGSFDLVVAVAVVAVGVLDVGAEVVAVLLGVVAGAAVVVGGGAEECVDVCVVLEPSGSVYWLSPADGPVASAATGPITSAANAASSQVVRTRRERTLRVLHQ